MKQIALYKEGKLKINIDMGEKTSGGRFKGLDKVADAVEVCTDIC